MMDPWCFWMLMGYALLCYLAAWSCSLWGMALGAGAVGFFALAFELLGKIG